MVYDEYRYGNYSQWQPPRRSAFTSGMGGESGVYNGQLMISARDRSQAEARYYEEKAQRDEQMLRDGSRQDWIQVRNSRAMADQKKNEAANGGRTESFFTRPESEANWAELNGPRGDGPSKYLPRWMQAHNTGETWQGFQAAGAGTSGMGTELGFVGGDQGGGGGGFGGGLPSGMREASYTKGSADPGGGYQPLISTESGGRIAEYKQQRDGSFSGQIINPYSAFSGEQWRQNTGQMPSTAGGYAGLPTSQQQPQQAIPNVRNYGWDSTSGVEQDNFPTPYQMRGDYASGRFENVTEDSYDPAPADEWMQTRKGPSSWSDQYQTPSGSVRLTGTEPMSDELPLLEKPDDWDESDDEAPLSTGETIKESINNRAESQMTGNEAQDQEAELERQRTIKALDDYSKRGFLPGYRAEDGSRRPSDVSVYGNKRESGMVRRVGDALDDAGSSIASGAKQAFNRVKEGAGKVLDLYPPELSDDPRFTDVRTGVRQDGRMSRQEAMSNGEILSPRDQEAVERFKMEQILNQVDQHMKSSALAPENPRIAMEPHGRRDFDADFQSKTRHEFGPMEAGEIEAQMMGVKKSPRMDNDRRQVPMRPMTHRDVLAQYFGRALGGGIG